MRTFKILMFTVLSLFLTSCSYVRIEFNDTDGNVNTITKSGLESVYRLQNPYSLDVMQTAADSLCAVNNIAKIVLLPSHYYVRFSPADSAEFRLIEGLGIPLFDHPLDEYSDGSVSLSRTDIDEDLQQGIQQSPRQKIYAVVPYLTIMPDVMHDTLDVCYIPNNDYARNSDTFGPELEELAFRIANPETDYPEQFLSNASKSTSSSYSGTLAVDTVGNGSVLLPLGGVEVVVWSFVKVERMYTDVSGTFYGNKSFWLDPHFKAVLNNIRGFSVYKTLVNILPASIDFGRKPKNSNVSLVVPRNTSLDWNTSIISYSAFDYYNHCIASGRILPPDNLRIVAMPDIDFLQGSGAPMLGKIRTYDLEGSLSKDRYVNMLNYLGPVVSLLSFLLPDVVITYYNDIPNYKRAVYHELSHASHYAVAGDGLWNRVISATVRYSYPVNLGYGDGLDNDANQDALALAESWAYANNVLHFNQVQDKWFNYSIDAIVNLILNEILSESEILFCMSSGVMSVNSLYLHLCETYPHKKRMITRVFLDKHALHELSYLTLSRGSMSPVYADLRLHIQENNQHYVYGFHDNDACAVVAVAPYLVSSPGDLRQDMNYFPDSVYLSYYGHTIVTETSSSSVDPDVLFGLSPTLVNELFYPEGNRRVRRYDYCMNF